MKGCPARLWPPLLVAAVAVVTLALAQAADPLPPKPAQFVEDRAGILSPQSVAALNTRLAAFERATSTQVLVAIFPDVPGDYAMEDFTQRTAEAWGVGQRREDNGVVLFIFPQARKLRIEVGYGLEGALPDIVAKRIIENEIKPAFRAGKFDEGVTRGVDAILQAVRGEYTGTGRTNAEAQNRTRETAPFSPLIFLILFILFAVIAGNRQSARRGRVYGPMGRRDVWIPPVVGGWGGGGGAGRSSGRGGDGGGFSGGGGSFGGGGASGDW